MRTQLNVVAAVLVSSLLLPPAASFAHGSKVVAATVAKRPAPQFATEIAAQDHCPADVVVWLNTETGIYHEKGMLWYGKTHSGGYVCRQEANRAGDRNTPNGR